MFTMNGGFPSDTETIIGRLPWRTLGLEPIRDGHGECLWYAISANHKSLGISSIIRMNWDTLGHLDIVVANSSAALVSALANAHERPVVVIFSPGPPLPGQNRSPPSSPPPAGDDVTECGGNYNVANYLDPAVPAALGGVTNYLAGTNSASGVTGDSDPDNDPDAPKALSPRGKVFDSGGSFLPHACQGANCDLVANDKGLELTGDALFGAIRKHAYFRTDINALLDRTTDCLRDEIAALGGPVGYARIAGADNNTCYGSGVVPLGYYPHYRDQMFVARGAMTVNGTSCPAALLFSSQRNLNWVPTGEPTGNTPVCPKTVPANPYQCRHDAANRADASNYLEGINQTNFGAGTTFSGQELFERVSSTQTLFQDIVRCVPSTPNFVTTSSPGLIAAGLPQLANYSPTTRILTLGQPVLAALPGAVSNFLYGCAWRPETHTLGGGLRSYFTFRINDAGGATWPTMGITYAMVDGDNNATDACGAAAQHLGYSGNNTESPFIAQPKIAFEIDPRREIGFNASNPDHLLNGRNDPASPSYTGGHVAIDYWGGETSFPAMPFALAPAPKCSAPAFDPGFGANCYLPQEEDDNVHARSTLARTGFPAPPANPPIPATELAVPPDSPMGAYKLDTDLTATPVNKDFHVRVELTRTTPPNVRVSTAANLNLGAPGNPVNGVTLTAGDRVWVRQQTVPAENGFYIWNGAGVAMTPVSAPTAESASNFSLPRVRVATTGDISINSASDPVVVDGVYLFDGDRILVKDQAAPPENGIYYWKAAENRLIRADDADSAAELAGMAVEVRQGALNAGSIWRQNTTNLVLDATALSWNNIRVKLAVAPPPAIDVSNPGATLDGIRMKAGDRVFIKTKGIYIYVWNGALSRYELTPAPAPDNTAGSIVQILQGSEAASWWHYDGAAWTRLSVRVAAQSNLALAAPGGSIDGVTMAVGDRVLLKSQTNAAENGIYVWTAPAAALTRAADAATPALLAGALTQVLAGSDVGRAFRQTTLAATGIIDASPVQWAALDRSTSYLLEIWILIDSPSYTDKIAAMKDTTRAMSLLYPGFTPHLQDRPVIPYSFRNARPGFTIGQRTSVNDQTVSIMNSFTTWLE